MKRYFYIVLLAFIGSCSDDDDKFSPETVDLAQLTGTWQLVAASFSIGTPEVAWQDISEGYTYTFRPDGTFSSNRYPDCSGNNFSIVDAGLILNFDCEDFPLMVEESTELRRGFLYLSPKAPVMCIEGCQYRFRKVI